ncbi:uncharacterized protein LACBIDRAFT_314661, partial [Laccaria bicolor S238N-H82]
DPHIVDQGHIRHRWGCAGIQGSAGVTVAVHGLPLGGGPETATGQIDLFGLPFQGSVRVGKKGLFKAGWEGVLEHLGMSR